MVRLCRVFYIFWNDHHLYFSFLKIKPSLLNSLDLDPYLKFEIKTNMKHCWWRVASMETGINVAEPLFWGASEVRGPGADASQTGLASASCKKRQLWLQNFNFSLWALKMLIVQTFKDHIFNINCSEFMLHACLKDGAAL